MAAAKKTVIPRTPLREFLSRNPWGTRALLETVFTEIGFGVAFESEGAQLHVVDVPRLGTVYACQEEPAGSIVHAHRLNLVRQYVIDRFGPDALTQAISPSPAADCEFMDGNAWYRIWGDLGGVSVEAQSFVRNPPERYPDEVVDIIVTVDPGRVDALRLQLERNWRGGGKVIVETPDGARFLNVSLPGQPEPKGAWRPYLTAEIAAMIAGRMAREYPPDIYKQVHELIPLDWILLDAVGNNPLLTPVELANMIGWDEYLGPVVRSTDKYYKVISPGLALQRIVVLKNFGLIAAFSQTLPEERFLLTSKAMALFAQYWGVKIDDLQRFHPWPQKIEDGRLIYSDHWLEKMLPHQTLCRHFVLSMVFGGRSVSSGKGGVDVRAETMIGGRITYESLDHKVVWFTPDAVARATTFTAMPGVSRVRPVSQMLLLIEIDRATNPLSRLDEKFERYLGVWRSLVPQNPFLVWVIDGTPYREKYILEQMKKYNIAGWTVTLDRLRLGAGDSWWNDYPPFLGFDFFYASTGGLAPFRKIWFSTDSPTTPSYLLGAAPWSTHSVNTRNSLNGILDKYRGRS